ncbi:hypothetical protein PGT21_026463 [Puccinia graminis f. sp. tritici]|uniref:Uncharacterized protein n=1 Tax=Puccinia graminis f. sp. tritici TaxID=56615 RepID=A0A5B0PLX2_PUCGR|nr:hypothetical protein PGT21_026463 [Puccinia graminis f. sp. tritici]
MTEVAARKEPIPACLWGNLSRSPVAISSNLPFKSDRAQVAKRAPQLPNLKIWQLRWQPAVRVQMGRARAQKCCPNPTRLPWWAGAGRAAQAKHVPTPDPLPKGVGLGLGAGWVLGAQRAPTKKEP